ncbi:cyclopropane-fatty-acyl-phospholipid synthase family protein [Marinovum sp. 2_MG-2023]|uniref:SAM-dependent methyltransferase n=1 Tax=unclassified Marinovum TaxID=2647166 RepID=UPI0026E437BF|nr:MULTISPECIES: cyclopropane-fatty-acyl-phospholipid synthase family protein [unclassified Marinovum]MDO6732855.1 cyclopropane-fatty-acyl-phospholipid synthase family protein [Marinovum sp. 2_MG-2023]MDO6782133.1 cyclopropane-fatty-acyl-phospholipid synthase family protein [Marinovum sp. 1_MG-2023]
MLFLTKKVKRDFLDSCQGIHSGSLRLRTPEGEIYDFGNGGVQAELQLHDWSVVTAVATRGDVGLGETYVAGLWDSPSIVDLSTVALHNFDHLDTYVYGNFWNRLKMRLVDQVLRANSRQGSSRNIRAHYDVGNEFYQLWLDPSMTYSSALFQADDDDLLRGQNRKYDRILDRLTAGERVMEIGCGWGGFAERAADAGRHVTGLTISPSQKGYADARLDGRGEIRLQDYRDCDGTFDNIVSIEMVEAVGQRYWPTYFATLKNRLAEGGRAVVQAITVQDANFETYRTSSDFIRQHTFPGGLLLSDAMIADQARKAGLVVRDNFAFGQDYARTCAIWSEQLQAQEARIRKLGHGDAFLRTWRYYLDICTATFATGRTDVVQVELAHA